MRRYIMIAGALAVASVLACAGCSGAVARETHPALGAWALTDQSGHDVIVLTVAEGGTLEVGDWSPGALVPNTSYEYRVVDSKSVSVETSGSTIVYTAQGDQLGVSIDGLDFGQLDRAVSPTQD